MKSVKIYKAVDLIFIVPVFLAFVQLMGCKKFLDKKSDNSLVVPTTLQDAQALLENPVFMNYITPSLGESSSDDYFWPEDIFNSAATREQLDYTWTPWDRKYQNDWSFGYGAIYYTNLSLQVLEKIPVTSQNEIQWKKIKGSALFLRAFWFLHLSWIYSKAYDETTAGSDWGIALKLIPDFNIPTVRASVQQSYDKVIDDTKEAAGYLPDISDHTLRPSRAAAYALLARAYLSMRKYDSAFKYSDLSLGIKNDLLDYNVQDNDVININAPVPFRKFNRETIFYSEINGFRLTSPVVAKIDSLLYLSYDSNDLRKTAFFMADPPYQKFKGSYAQSTSVHFSGITTAEMYLVRAECYARKGNKDAALADLNTLLVRRWKAGSFIPVTAATSQDAFNKIMIERRKELLMRSLRWVDLKRLNKEGANIVLKRVENGQTYTLLPNANYYALPIPKDIIDLTGIPQNPYP